MECLPGSDPALLARIGDAVRARLDAAPAVVRIPTPGLDLYAAQAFIPAEECAALIALIDEDAQPSVALGGGQRAGLRTSSTCRLSADHPLVARIDARIANLLGLSVSHSETVEGQRYTVGQEFRLHSDYFAPGQPYSDAAAGEGGQRSWTAMVYLDRPEAGGATGFPFVPIAIPPTPGMLLAWDNMGRDGLPNPQSRHAGMPVEAGAKHILTKWFREREWQGSAASDALRD